MNQSQSPATRKFDVGGQAVMEGVMMRSPNATAVTVRRPDGSMVTKLTPFVPLKEKHPWMGKPFIRGIINMGTMLYYGMNTLSDSTKMLGLLDEEPSRFEKWLAEKLGKSVEKIVMALAIILAVALSLGIFMALPAGLESLLKSAGVGPVGYTLLGGLLKIALLVGYMFLVGFVLTLWVIIEKLVRQAHGLRFRAVTDQPLFYLALVALVLGVILFLAGFVGEMVSRSSAARNDYNIKARL